MDKNRGRFLDTFLVHFYGHFLILCLFYSINEFRVHFLDTESCPENGHDLCPFLGPGIQSFVISFSKVDKICVHFLDKIMFIFWTKNCQFSGQKNVDFWTRNLVHFWTRNCQFLDTGKGRGGMGREGKGRGGEGMEGKGRKGKGREGKGRDGEVWEGKGREGKRMGGTGRKGKEREGKGSKGKGRLCLCERMGDNINYA